MGCSFDVLGAADAAPKQKNHARGDGHAVLLATIPAERGFINRAHCAASERDLFGSHTNGLLRKHAGLSVEPLNMEMGLYQKSVGVETYNESSSHDQRSTGFVHDTSANNRDFVSKPLTWRKLLIQPTARLRDADDGHPHGHSVARISSNVCMETRGIPTPWATGWASAVRSKRPPTCRRYRQR